MALHKHHKHRKINYTIAFIIIAICLIILVFVLYSISRGDYRFPHTKVYLENTTSMINSTLNSY